MISLFLILAAPGPGADAAPPTSDPTEVPTPAEDSPGEDVSAGDDSGSILLPEGEPVDTAPNRMSTGPKEYGPFYEPAPVSEVSEPSKKFRPYPLFSVGKGAFCFVEDNGCKSSLILDADVGIGLNIVAGSARGIDVPYTQVRFRGGVTARPLTIARGKWHPWGVGAVGSYSLGSPQITTGQDSSEDVEADVVELQRLETLRLGVMNQLWLSQKRNGFHVDLTLGGARSTVLDAPGQFWGTHVEVAAGFGGWAGLYASGDFLDRDTRLVFGFRGHGIATAPILGLVALGLLAGGAL